MRVGVLVSGRGSNLQALLDASKAGTLGGAQIAVVISNIPGAYALERARNAGVAAETIDHTQFPKRAVFDAKLVETLRAHRVDLVCLAGFMRIVGREFLDAFPQRVLNIHPSLLPAFPGLHAHRQALEAGVKITGVTVHFVDAGTDTGPILAQAAIPILPDDSEDSLGDRVLVAEHRLYPAAVRMIGEGRVRIEGRRVVLDGAEHEPAGLLFNPRL